MGLRIGGPETDGRERAGYLIGFAHPELLSWSLHLLEITTLHRSTTACETLWNAIRAPLLSMENRKKILLRDGRERNWSFQKEEGYETIKRLILMSLGQGFEQAAKAALISELSRIAAQRSIQNIDLVVWAWDLFIEIEFSKERVKESIWFLETQRAEQQFIFEKEPTVRGVYWSLLSKCQQKLEKKKGKKR